MKKSGFFVVVITILILLNIRAFADEAKYTLNGLENIPKTYEAGTDPLTIDFTQGLELYINEEILAPEKLLVKYNPDNFNNVGSYEVEYYVIFLTETGEVEKLVETIDIDIVDTTNPRLYGIKPITLKLNTRLENVNFLAGVTAIDNDKSSELNISVITDNIVVSKAGLYPITYWVQDRSGNYAEYTTFVSVQENINSLIKLVVNQPEFNIKVNHQDPESYYYNAVSAFDGTVDITDYVKYNDDGVDYTKIGEYQVFFFVSDKFGNLTHTSIPVNIIEDDEAPYFENLEDVFELTIFTNDYFKGLIAYDEVCGDVSDRIKVELDKGFRYDLEGEYPATYSVSDLNGNTATKAVTIHVIDNLAPEIDAPESIYIALNKPIDLAGKIEIIDNVDGEIKDYLLHENNLDISKVGTYFLKVSASDKKGNVAIKNITIYVYNDDDVFYKNPIVVGSLCGIVVSGIISYIVYRKSKQNYYQNRRPY
jgi:hypothetical protein